ncbi:MAG: efflux RND transporter periplasmic adaptor subunit [Myxococcaceae bacterium]|nr:efflux RND transporter periplasmic adaptor subunit [Myxococcaceae bacterium]
MRWWPVTVVALLQGCEQRPVVTAPSAAPAATSATTRWVESRSAEDTALLEAPARVLPSPEGVASIAPPLQARIVRVRVRPGQRVAAQEPIIDVLMPEVLHAAGDLAGEQLKVEAFTRRKSQLEALKSEGLVRLAELAEVEAQLATARADAQAARATLRASGVSDRQAEALVTGDGVLSLRTPTAGLVTIVDVVPGEVRDPAGKPLVQIVGAGEGRLEARLPSTPAPGARFSFLTGPLVLPIELVSVSPRFEPTDGARLAWFSAPADGGTLPIGATGRVRASADAAWRVIPSRALLEQDGLVHVRQRTGEGWTLVVVTVIARSGAEAVVVGLPEHAVVAAEGSEVR